MTTLPRDARFALRAHARPPVGAAAAVAVLAVGLGATTAILTVARTLCGGKEGTC